jgi:outer membrane protein
MNNKKTCIRTAAVAAALCGVALSAQAQRAGTWFGGLGITRIAPDVTSGNLTPPSAPGTKVDIDADTKPVAFLGRMLTDNWSVEVPIGLGFKHRITGDGAISGVGLIGTTRVLPISVFAQYRFLEPASRWRPYVMLGVTYAYFYDEKGSATLNAVNPANPPGGNTSLNIDSRWGLTPGLGLMVNVGERWFVDAHYAKSFLKTRTTLSTGQTIDTKLDPDVYTIGVGVRF